MNETVTLVPMTADLYHAYAKDYQNDPDLYTDKSKYTPYVYDKETADRYIQRQIDRKRIFFAIMAGGEPVGELILKNIEPHVSATLGITMKNAAYKDRGFGTQAERLAIDYVFHTLDIPVLYADAILSNTRSQHVLEKVGFRLIKTEGDFKYYRIERNKLLPCCLHRKTEGFMITEVNHTTVLQAATVHSISWQASHRSFCTPEFIAAHTPERQRTYLCKKMENGSRFYLLTNPDPVGIVSVTGNLIEDLYVLPDRQNRGYGIKLLQFAVRQCCGTPTLWILENNTDAARLYRRMGFKETGNVRVVPNGRNEIEFSRE
mgnify:CR=1 FL=1